MRHQQTTLLRIVPIRLLILFQYSLNIRAAQSIDCYFPNGDAITDSATSSTNDFYVPCNQSFGNDNQHMCCKTASPFNDVCNPDGLCARDNNPGLGEDQGLMRSTCTDPSWTSPSCLKLCTTGIDYLGNLANGTEQYVKQCSDGSWCCEAESPPLTNLNKLNSTEQDQVNTCCDQGKGVFIDNGKISTTNPKGTATNSSGAASTTKSSSAINTSTPLPQHSNHAGAIAGGVVGGVAVLVIIAAAIFFLARRSRNSKAQKNPTTPAPIYSNNIGRHEAGGTGLPLEKQGNEIIEKDGAPMTREKPVVYEI